MPVHEGGFWYDLVAAVLRPPLMVATRRHWCGQHHIPATGGVIIVANHLSYADPLTLAHFVHDRGRVPRFVAKASLFEIPVVGRIIAAAGQIPIRRETRVAGDALRAASAALRAGQCLVIYPEGTITRDPDLWPMVGRTGAARLALETGCAVVPVAQWGPQAVLAPYAKMPRILPRKVMSVCAGAPLDLAEFRTGEMGAAALKAATATIMGAVTAMLARIRRAAPPSTPFDPRLAGVPSIGNPRRRQRRP